LHSNLPNYFLCYTWVIQMSGLAGIPQYIIQTKDGIFAVVQSMSYGDIVIAAILFGIFVLQLVKLIFQMLAYRGYI